MSVYQNSFSNILYPPGSSLDHSQLQILLDSMQMGHWAVAWASLGGTVSAKSNGRP